MSIDLPSELTARFLDRKALLWICQRAELSPEGEPHANATSLEHAVAQYRSEPDQEDLDLASLFWEACWTESIVDLFSDAVGKLAGGATIDASAPLVRLPYRLTTDPDVEGQIDRRQILPVYEINGTSRPGDPDGQHGNSPARRLAFKMGLIRRLESFPGRAIVIVGAQGSADLETVRSAIDFVPSNCLVAVLWPPSAPPPDDSEFPSRLSIHFIRGTRADLVTALSGVGAPESTTASRFGIRYGRSTLELMEEDFVGIDQEFILIRENDLQATVPTDGGGASLERLWRSEPNDWAPFASDLVFRRYYRPIPDSDEDLANTVVSLLTGLSDSGRVLNFTLTVPATSGSGVTTALRHAAFLAAKSGFPTLLCKPDNQRFSVEKLSAFLTRLQDKSRGKFSGEEAPALVIFDREHRGIEQVSELAMTLESRGRRALVIEVISPTGEDSEGPLTRRPRGRHRTAQVFRGAIDNDELEALVGHFTNLMQPLGVSIPTMSDWSAYQASQNVQTLAGEQYAESLFWIALRFFVGEGNPHFDLAQWVGRTFEQRVKEPAAQIAVRYIAAFSSFGIAVPLVPLLRKVGVTKILDTSILPILRDLSESEDLLQWGDSEEYLQDQTICFKHRLIAIQLLNQLRAVGWNDRLRECWGLLESLEATPVADGWLVETLVFEALRVGRDDPARLPVILDTFDHIPSLIASRSAPTQHHWGRALGFQARQTDDTAQRIVIYSKAIEKLALASQLAEGERGRENPRNIYTSLGVMRSDLSRVFRNNGEAERSQDLWQSAASAFESALRLGPDNFVVLSAFARRLIEHAREIDDEPQVLSEIASALSFLAQAEEAALLTDSLSAEDASYLQMERNNAWQVVDSERAEHHIEELIDHGDEVGYILRAYRLLGDITDEDWRQGTAIQLERAFDTLSPIQHIETRNLSWRSIYLLYRVVSSLRSRRFDFEHRLALLDSLDSLGFRWHSGLRFAQAVLSYQIGDNLRGYNLFRALRTSINSGYLQPVRLTSFLRDPNHPSNPRLASVRIQRVTSDWVAYGEVPEMNGQQVLARPRWFEVPPRTGDVRQCHILFEIFGPLAVPTNRRLTSLID